MLQSYYCLFRVLLKCSECRYSGTTLYSVCSEVFCCYSGTAVIPCLSVLYVVKVVPLFILCVTKMFCTLLQRWATRWTAVYSLCYLSVLSVVTVVPLFIPRVAESFFCYSGAQHCGRLLIRVLLNRSVDTVVLLLFRVLLKCSVRCYSGEQHGGLSHGSAACSVCLCHQHLHRCSLQQRPMSGVHRQGRHCDVQMHLSDVLWNRRLQHWSSCVVVSSQVLCDVLMSVSFWWCSHVCRISECVVLMMQSCVTY